MKDKPIIISGLHMDLTEALKQNVNEKMAKLFRHEDSIIRLRIELEYCTNASHQDDYIAKGHIDINGAPIVISVASDDLYKSIDELSNKLDRKLRRRSRLQRVKRKDTHDVDIPAELPKVA